MKTIKTDIIMDNTHLETAECKKKGSQYVKLEVAGYKREVFMFQNLGKKHYYK
jgi:hypothetical protein